MSWKKHEYPSGYYVYELIDPFSNQPFYVGKGKRNRAYEHLREAITSIKSSAKLNQIRDILTRGGDYTINVVKSNLSESEACDLEIILIRQYGRRHYDENGILTNILVSTHQADFSKVIYKRGPDHHGYGKKRTDESIAKQRATCAVKSKVLKTKLCKCGCGVQLPTWLVNKAANQRSHSFASWHFDGLLNNSERHLKILELNRIFLELNRNVLEEAFPSCAYQPAPATGPGEES